MGRPTRLPYFSTPPPSQTAIIEESSRRLLDSAFDVATSPLDLAWITAQFHVLAGLGILEPEHGPVALDEHDTRSGFNLLSREVANSTFSHIIASADIEFSSFSTRISKHENIPNSNWTDDVPVSYTHLTLPPIYSV